MLPKEGKYFAFGLVRGSFARLAVCMTIDGPYERELVEHRGLLGQILADVGTGQLRGYRLERPPDFRWPVGFRIPGIDLRWTAGHPQQDHGLVSLGDLAFRAKSRQRRQSEPAETCEARFQNRTSSMHHHPIPHTRVHEGESVRAAMTSAGMSRRRHRQSYGMVAVDLT